MSLELIRIDRSSAPPADKAGLGLQAVRLVRERPYVAAAVAPLAFLGAGAVALTASAVAAASAIAVGEARIRRRMDEHVRVIGADETNLYRALAGDRLRDGIVYARHPKVGRGNLLVPANRFHQHVVNEQIADLVTYLRATVRVSSLKIYIKSEKGLTVGVNGILKAVPLVARLHGKEVEETAFEQTFDRPSRVSSTSELEHVWLADFPHIQAAAQNARHGTVKFGQTFDYSFGLEANAAKAAGIKADWMSTYTFEIHAAFA